MKRNKQSIFAIVFILFFMAAGCMKVVKEEESIQKTAEPSAVTQPQQPEGAEAAKEEAVPVKEETVAEQPIGEEMPKAAAALPAAEVSEGVEGLMVVYFDFDRFTIRDDMKPVLDKNAGWLRKNQDVKIEIQGHCDERGTNEYNIALGERRAQSIKKYLTDSGINEARLNTISYGEEKPADPGHTEEAWGKNRRAEFVIKR